MLTVNRRRFLASAIACGGALRAQPPGKAAQTFLAGLVPGAPPRPAGSPPSGPPAGAAILESFWRACDDCCRLGVHYIEVNNTNRLIVESYESRVSEFRDEMAKRGLTMLGFAVYSHMHDTARRRELIDYHLRVARFLKPAGGRYIAHLLAPAANLGNGDDESYRSMDRKATIANVNEVGKRVVEETGIRIAYHAEQGDIRAGIYGRLLDSTDERYLAFLPDVGHFAACGLAPLEICKKYRSRMIATHLRDVIPAAGPGSNGQAGRGRMVPFGTGAINLPALVGYLRETRFTGAVMGEGGGNEAMRNYMAETLKLDFGGDPACAAPNPGHH